MTTSQAKYIPNARENLNLMLMTVDGHSMRDYTELGDVLVKASGLVGIERYSLGIVEGAERDTPDVQALRNTGLLERIVDRFVDPLNEAAFEMFRRHPENQKIHLEETAAKYVSAWLRYAKKEGYSSGGMHKSFSEVFKDIFPQGYLNTSVLSRVNRINKSGRSEDLDFHNLKLLIELVNNASVDGLHDELKMADGNIFVFCGSEHEAAILQAIARLNK